jgi:TonB family protein
MDPDNMARPAYPYSAITARREGSVVLRASVEKTGKTTDLTVVEGEPTFAKPSLAAVRKWRFHPAIVEGQPVETTYKVEVRFVLATQEAIPRVTLMSPREAAWPSDNETADLRPNPPESAVYSSKKSGVIPPRVTYFPEPEFPRKARKAKGNGIVGIRLIVGTDGVPSNLRVKCSSAPDLTESAVRAVSAWRFQPGTKDGNPMMVEITVEVSFHK